MPKVLDEVLVRAGRGDQDAFAEVYDEVVDTVYGLCLRLVGDPAGAEAAAHDALVAVWRTAAAFDPDRGSARAWVIALAHDHAVRLRRAAAGSPRGLEELEERAPRPGSRAEQDAQALDLVYFGGCTYREVADRRDESPDLVLRRLQSALTVARRSLSLARPVHSS